MKTKIDLLQEHRERLAAAMDTLIDSKTAISKSIDELAHSIEKVKEDILDEVNHTRRQYEADQRHMALENED